MSTLIPAVPAETAGLHTLMCMHTRGLRWVQTWFGTQGITLGVVDVHKVLVPPDQLVPGALCGQVAVPEPPPQVLQRQQVVHQLTHRPPDGYQRAARQGVTQRFNTLVDQYGRLRTPTGWYVCTAQVQHTTDNLLPTLNHRGPYLW